MVDFMLNVDSIPLSLREAVASWQSRFCESKKDNKLKILKIFRYHSMSDFENLIQCTIFIFVRDSRIFVLLRVKPEISKA